MKLVQVTGETFINERDPEMKLRVHYTNMGEPYDQGVSLTLEDGINQLSYVELGSEETGRLYQFLKRLHGE